MTMLATTPTSGFVSRRGRPRDSSMSPSCRSIVLQHTPPRLSTDPSSAPPSYDSPMLTPSPLKKRVIFPPTIEQCDPDDIFLQSPFRSPPPVHRLYPLHMSKPQPISIDDDEGGIFLASSSAPHSSPFFPASTSQPLRTPVKQAHRVHSRPALSTRPANAQSAFKTPASACIGSETRVGVGTKRKSTPHTTSFSTPLRQRATTPLSISASKTLETSSGMAFHRLAPLPAPRFVARTPQTKAETEAYVKRQAETMTRLNLRDIDHPREKWDFEDDDSGIEVGDDEDDRGDELFLDRLPEIGRSKPRSISPKKPLNIDVVKRGNGKEEVAEAISPGGHIIKRRARSRPVSLELLESIHQTPSPPASSLPDPAVVQRTCPPRTAKAAVAFPSVARDHARNSSASSSEAGSPRPRRRLTGSSGPRPPVIQSRSSDSVPPRAPMSRLASSSSATLFFGPAITPVDPPTPSSPAPGKLRSRTSSSILSLAKHPHATLRLRSSRPRMSNRHSYAGPGSASLSPLPWTLRSSTLDSFSPNSSPASLPRREEDTDDDEMTMFESGGPPDSSFVFSVTEGTPSPRSKRETLATKFKPRDSGVVLTDDEDMGTGSDFLAAMPRASTSVSSIYSDANDDLVTPGVAPGATSGWPGAVVVDGWDDCDRSFGRPREDGVDVDAFILRTLAAGGKVSAEENKKPPGTPVKKMKTSHLAGNRPWQSAVAAKVGFNFGLDLAPAGKSKNGPRKSLPAALSALGPKRGKMGFNDSDTDEEQENSPSSRKESKYEGLGLGRPPSFNGPSGPVSRTRWLMRRSSSGAFSSGSEVSMGTPTGRKDWNLPPPRIPSQLSPAKSAKNTFSRSSSNSSVVTLNSPTMASRTLPAPGSIKRPPGSPLIRRDDVASEHDRAGRFEREFVEIEQVGSGEFGKVMKVRGKNGPMNEVYAVKKSKRFEGSRHRLRLREEVDVLQHLAQAAAADANSSQGQHPNVLAYIDSWEQDEALYIRTELCELGNFARFLWEYGRVFPRLDEARVWKIMVDLSNGLRFIHDSGVIHLDFKPANIFVTGEGRFKIGDFGMGSVWPRVKSGGHGMGVGVGGFEREGDKVYLAREVLQGKYGKAADMFSFGMTMLETATNIVVPDQGEAWHRLRQEDFSLVDLDGSPELFELIKRMMRTEPGDRIEIEGVCGHGVVSRARGVMERTYMEAKVMGTSVFAASPLAGVGSGFLEEILGARVGCEDMAMDESI